MSGSSGATPSNDKASGIACSGAIYGVDRGFNSPNRKCSIRDFDLARLRGCPGKPGAGNPHAGFYLGGEAQGQPRLLPTDHKINQAALLDKIHTSSHFARPLKAWLKAGVVDSGIFMPTDEGTPQRGVASPLLANIALHGLGAVVKQAGGPGKSCKGGKQVTHQTHCIQYAD